MISRSSVYIYVDIGIEEIGTIVLSDLWKGLENL